MCLLEYINMCNQCSQRPEVGCRFLWSWGYRQFWVTWPGCWELNLGPLKDHQVLFTIQPLFQSSLNCSDSLHKFPEPMLKISLKVGINLHVTSDKYNKTLPMIPWNRILLQIICNARLIFLLDAQWHGIFSSSFLVLESLAFFLPFMLLCL